MKKRFTIVFLFFALIQCHLYAQKVNKNNKNTISFEINGLIIFKGMINGKEANIAWDNGFSNTTVDQTFYKKNNLQESAGLEQVLDANGKKFDVNKSLLKSLQFGNTAIPNLAVDVADFSQLPMKIDAILGADIINKYIWDFNFDKNEIYLSKNQIEKTTTYEIPFIIGAKYNNNHTVDAYINNKPLEIQIDFGNTHEYLTVKTDSFEKIFSTKKKLTFEGWGDIGIAGKDKNTTSLLLDNDYSFNLGGVYLPKKYIPFADDKENIIYSGTLGFQFFRKLGNLVIDPFSKKYKIYSPSRTLEPYSYSSFGFILYINEGKITVVKIIKESDNIIKNNILVVDVIKSVDGKKASDFIKFQEIRDYLNAKQQITIITSTNKEIILNKEHFFK
ncbi:aspartyl protease family protein [Chryseobacterium sp.]|uniref:aspartyl protease family protein n=1 Tax=Chryseobacterium sp. TaxID=1871047 RepID=UPI00289C026C|nr:aspartyl protease family protein [Chryseobacterium sp.]